MKLNFGDRIEGTENNSCPRCGKIRVIFLLSTGERSTEHKGVCSICLTNLMGIGRELSDNEKDNLI